MIDLMKKQRAASVLGVALDGNRIEAVVVRRTNGSVAVQQSMSASMALSPLTGAPDLVGREIRNHLESAGIREGNCVVCIPLSWVLTMQTAVPDLPPADVESFLDIEAERGFPSAIETLMVCRSVWRGTDGGAHATLMAVPRNHLTALLGALKSARLKPSAFVVGVAEMQRPEKDRGIICLAMGDSSIALEVVCGGGIAALRSLDGVIEKDGEGGCVDADAVAREIRITLGQLPGGLGGSVRKLRIFGESEASSQLADELADRARAMGLEIELMEHPLTGVSGRLPARGACSGALAAAVNRISGAAETPDFLPPKAHPWKQFFAGKLSSRKLAWVGVAAGVAALFAALAFLVQQARLWRLESKWNSMSEEVASLENAQQLAGKYRPWFDESCRGMRMLRVLSEAFPDDGSVSVKSLETQNLSAVTCSGVARDNKSFLKLVDRLRKTREISELKIDQLRGAGPLQFTFNFKWEGVKSNGN